MRIEDFPITMPNGSVYKGIVSKLTCDCGKEVLITQERPPCLTNLLSLTLDRIKHCEFMLHTYKRDCKGKRYCQKELANWQALGEQLKAKER